MYQQINATLGAPVYADATVTTAEELDYRAVHDMPSAEYYSQIDAAEYVAVDEDVAAATGGDTGNTGNTGNDGHASATAGSEIIYAVAVEDVAGSSGGSGGSGGGGGGGNPTGRGASWNPEDEASYEEMVSPTTTTPASPSTSNSAATLPAPTPTGVSYVNLAPNLCSGGSDAQPATTSSTAAGASYVNLAPDQSTGVHGQHGGAGRAEHAYVNLDPAAECAVDGAVEAHAYINLTPDGVPVEVAPPTIVPRQVRAVAHSNGDDNAESDSSGYDA